MYCTHTSQIHPISQADVRQGTSNGPGRRLFVGISCWNLLGAGLVGLAFPLIRHYVQRTWPSLPVSFEGAVVLALCIAVLLWIARRSDSYRSSLKVATATGLGLALQGSIAVFLPPRFGWGAYWWLPIVAVPFVFTVGFLVSGSVLCTAVYMRRRLHTIHQAGHCQSCGYCLFGLPNNRCPECGAEFSPQHSKET